MTLGPRWTFLRSSPSCASESVCLLCLHVLLRRRNPALHRSYATRWRLQTILTLPFRHPHPQPLPRTPSSLPVPPALVYIEAVSRQPSPVAVAPAITTITTGLLPHPLQLVLLRVFLNLPLYLPCSTQYRKVTGWDCRDIRVTAKTTARTSITRTSIHINFRDSRLLEVS